MACSVAVRAMCRDGGRTRLPALFLAPEYREYVTIVLQYNNYVPISIETVRLL
jgi:hypothetical protein